MKTKALLSAVLGCALLWAVSADAQKETIQSDENGEITLTQPTKVGDLTLQPDAYVVQHHATAGQDFIRFMKVKRERKLMVTRAYTGWYTDRELIKAGEVKCQVERLDEKAKATTLTVATENGNSRITQVVIKGRPAVYVF